MTPTATYRLQLTRDFGFDAAAALVPYLQSLGISHVYASPCLKARTGSTHGYDVIDHNALNPELGGAEAFARLRSALRARKIGLILDFVPNHMAVHGADNPWWLDVLEWGRASPYAKFFDIDWSALALHGSGGVLLPILGRPYGEALEAGEIELRYAPREGSFSAWCYEHRLPIAPRDYADILHRIVAAAGAANVSVGRQLLEIGAGRRREGRLMREDAAALKAALAALEGGAAVIERGLTAFRPRMGGAAALRALDHLLGRQHYRPAHWQLAATQINYRRFFDIDSLAGLRVENSATFDAIHRLVARLIANDELQGLRLDHIDGLRDPQGYCRRLQELVRSARPDARGFYVVVEKILGENEQLPPLPGVSGTTGYEWLNTISRVLLDPRGLDALDGSWREASGDERAFDQVLIAAKRQILATSFAADFRALALLLARIAGGHPASRDLPPERLRAALEAFVLHFPVYRTYVTAAGASAEDRTVIDATIAAARAGWGNADAGLFDFLRQALTLDLIAPGRVGYSKTRVRRFAFKMQQFTGPMMAKSLEDTAFYRYHRLLALNEVGGNPAAGALSAADFHSGMCARLSAWPHGLTATATHDTKRGEDARTRLLALAELAEDWAGAVKHWGKLNASLGSSGPPRSPSPAHEYMLYQALVGAWPLAAVDESFVERVQAYATKAAREGKEQTSWLAPDESYEAGLKNFLSGALEPRRKEFLESFDALARRAALIGACKSLAQVALKICMPGVPDIYQGTELWDLSLVDPDNRRLVDFAVRAAALDAVRSTPDWHALAAAWPDGRIKLALTRRLLALRQQFPALFSAGDYQPLALKGRDQHEILAFARRHGEDALIVVVGRLFGRATEGGRRWPGGEAWQASIVAEDFSALRHALTGGACPESPDLPLDSLFDTLPVAVLRARCTKSQAAHGGQKPARNTTGARGSPTN